MDSSNSSPQSASRSLDVVCTEVWGGNRLTDTTVRLPGLTGQIYSCPSNGSRGGDIHYLAVCNSGLITRMCLADVVGHGKEVAEVGLTIHGLLHRYMNRRDQRRILIKLNERLLEIGLRALTTAVMATYFPPRRQLSISYAGHPPGLLYRRSEGSWQPLSAGSSREKNRSVEDVPLGIDADATFTRVLVKVDEGDRLLLLTDGILETPSPTNERFGLDRLCELLQNHRYVEVAEMARVVKGAIRDWSGLETPSHDDLTWLLVQFNLGPPGFAMWHMIKNRFLGMGRKSKIE